MCVAALDALDFADSSIVDCDVVKLEILFPLGKVFGCKSLCSAVVCSVDKGIHISVERSHFSDQASDLVERGQET